MSSNDLIRREDAVFLLDTFIAEFGKELIAEVGDIEEPMSAEDLASIVTDIVVNILAVVKVIPAVPQEMSALEYDKQSRRMCKFYNGRCIGCPFNSDLAAGCARYAPLSEEAVSRLEKWAREHPEDTE